MPNCDISVVIPVLNEEENLPVLQAELDEVLGGMERPYEIIYVDDGSTDTSLQVLKDMAQARPHVRVIEFRRNFGQTAALDAGFHHAQGDIVVPMDADLQNDPRDIPALVARIEEGYDVVKGWRKHRKDKAISRRLPSFIANRLISWSTGVRLHDYGCTLAAFRKDIIKQVHLYGEMHRFIPVYTHLVGGKLVEMAVNHRPRIHGTTKYNITRTLRVMLDLLTVRLLVGYTTKPSYFFGKMGLMAFMLSFLLLSVTAWNKFVEGIFVKDQPLFLIAIFFGLVGFQIVLMGLLAELVMRGYFESQNKHAYSIRDVYGQAPAPPDEPHEGTPSEGTEAD